MLLSEVKNEVLMNEVNKRRKEAIAEAVCKINYQVEKLRSLGIEIQSSYVEGFTLEKIVCPKMNEDRLFFTEKFSKYD